MGLTVPGRASYSDPSTKANSNQGDLSMAKHGLGRGLNALLNETPVPTAASSADPQAQRVEDIPIDRIAPNPYQPRRQFQAAELEELALSIRANGILQPVLARRRGDRFELVTGERRLRAARQVGLQTVPAIVREVTDREMLEQGLIENLQRENLNVIEEAEGYQSLATKFNLSQDDIAQRVGKARATVANCMRLLSLPAEIRQMLADNSLQAGHAKVLLSVPLDEEKCFLARRAVSESWSVRVLEKAAARAARPPRKARVTRDDIPASHLQHLCDRLQRHFGTGIRIYPSRTLANGKKVKGVLEIDFYSSDDLNRIFDLLKIGDEH